MRVASLGSGSAGNSFLIESGRSRLLVDAGFSSRELERRLRRIDIAPASVEAVVLSHEHHDHSRGAERFALRHGCSIHATLGTLESLRWTDRGAKRCRKLTAAYPTEVAGFLVEPIDLDHDAREPVGFVVESSAGERVGIVTDAGNLAPMTWAKLRRVDVLLLEANHDPRMLADGPYPLSLKRRIAGCSGHLSNQQAAAGIAHLDLDRLAAVMLCHLSETNNRPHLALASIASELERHGSEAGVLLSHQARPSAWSVAGASRQLRLGLDGPGRMTPAETVI